MRNLPAPGGVGIHGGAELIVLLPQGSFKLGFTDSARFGAARAGVEPDHAEFGGRGKVPPRGLEGRCPSARSAPRLGDPAPSVPGPCAPRSQHPVPPQAAREDFRRSIVAAYSSQGHSQREKSLILLRAFAAASAASHPRLKRSVDRECFPLLWPVQSSGKRKCPGAGWHLGALRGTRQKSGIPINWGSGEMSLQHGGGVALTWEQGCGGSTQEGAGTVGHSPGRASTRAGRCRIRGCSCRGHGAVLVAFNMHEWAAKHHTRFFRNNFRE